MIDRPRGEDTADTAIPYPLTAKQLFRLPGLNTKFNELVRGALCVGEPSGGRSAELGARIMVLLGAYVYPRNLGFLTGEAGGYVLARNPDTVRAPDVAFMHRDRVPHSGVPREFIDGAPDLAVEVCSPSDRRKKVLEKVEDYLAAGTRLVWVVDIDQQTVTQYRPGSPPIVMGTDKTLDGEDVVPGFQLPITSLF